MPRAAGKKLLPSIHCSPPRCIERRRWRTICCERWPCLAACQSCVTIGQMPKQRHDCCRKDTTDTARRAAQARGALTLRRTGPWGARKSHAVPGRVEFHEAIGSHADPCRKPRKLAEHGFAPRQLEGSAVAGRGHPAEPGSGKLDSASAPGQRKQAAEAGVDQQGHWGALLRWATRPRRRRPGSLFSGANRVVVLGARELFV